jgi:nitroreductase
LALSTHPTTGFDLDEVDRLLTTTKQVRKRLDRPPLDPSTQGGAAAYYGSVLPGVWSFQLAARARGIGSAWTTFHLEHESEIAELLAISPTVTQVCLLAVGYSTGDTFTPAPRRPAQEVTFLNRWKQPVE